MHRCALLLLAGGICFYGNNDGFPQNFCKPAAICECIIIFLKPLLDGIFLIVHIVQSLEVLLPTPISPYHDICSYLLICLA